MVKSALLCVHVVMEPNNLHVSPTVRFLTNAFSLFSLLGVLNASITVCSCAIQRGLVENSFLICLECNVLEVVAIFLSVSFFVAEMVWGLGWCNFGSGNLAGIRQWQLKFRTVLIFIPLTNCRQNLLRCVCWGA